MVPLGWRWELVNFQDVSTINRCSTLIGGPPYHRELTAPGLRQLIAFISRMTAVDRAELEGVSPSRSQQIVAGALVAEAAMRALNINKLEICPWALREGIILRRIEQGDGPVRKVGRHKDNE